MVQNSRTQLVRLSAVLFTSAAETSPFDRSDHSLVHDRVEHKPVTRHHQQPLTKPF